MRRSSVPLVPSSACQRSTWSASAIVSDSARRISRDRSPASRTACCGSSTKSACRSRQRLLELGRPLRAEQAVGVRARCRSGLARRSVAAGQARRQPPCQPASGRPLAPARRPPVVGLLGRCSARSSAAVGRGPLGPGAAGPPAWTARTPRADAGDVGRGADDRRATRRRTPATRGRRRWTPRRGGREDAAGDGGGRRRGEAAESPARGATDGEAAGAETARRAGGVGGAEGAGSTGGADVQPTAATGCPRRPPADRRTPRAGRSPLGDGSSAAGPGGGVPR
jgi:hypothetical protein